MLGDVMECWGEKQLLTENKERRKEWQGNVNEGGKRQSG